MDCHRLTVVVHYIIPYGDILQVYVYTCTYIQAPEVGLAYVCLCARVCMRVCVCACARVCERVLRGAKWWREGRGGRGKKNKYLSSIVLCWNKITVAARRYRTQLLILPYYVQASIARVAATAAELGVRLIYQLPI